MQIFLAAVFLLAGPACSAPTPEPLESRSKNPSELTVFGKMWIVEDGVRRVPRDGSFRLCFARGTFESVLVSLDAGEFRQVLPEYSYAARIGRITIEGREAACMVAEGFVDMGVPLELEARFIPGSRLRVRLGDTCVELDRCELAGDSDYSSHPRMTALPHGVPAFPDDCPMFGWSRVRKYRAHHPGYAWARADVDLLSGGDVWIDLALEARLTVNVIAPKDLLVLGLEVWGPNGWQQPLSFPGETKFDGLEAGTYRVISQRPHARLASIELAAGESRSVTVDMTPDPSKPRVAVRGTLAIDPTWAGIASSSLEFRPLAPNGWQHLGGPTIHATAGPEGALPFDAGELVVGKYFVAMESVGWGARVEVVEGMGALALVVPPRVRCSVRLVEAETRKEVIVDSIAWRAVDQPANGALQWRTARRSPDSGRFELEAPRGPITFCTCSVGDQGLSSRDQVRELVSNPTDLALALEPASRIRVQLRDGERAVLFPDGVYPEVRGLDGSEVQEGYSATEEWRLLIVSPAGPCTVSLPAFGPWSEPAPLNVEARPREVVDVVFQLERKP